MEPALKREETVNKGAVEEGQSGFAEASLTAGFTPSPRGQPLRGARRLVTDEEAKFGPAFLLNELEFGLKPRGG